MLESTGSHVMQTTDKYTAVELGESRYSLTSWSRVLAIIPSKSTHSTRREGLRGVVTWGSGKGKRGEG